MERRFDARPGLFTAAAPPVTGAQLPPLVSLCLRVRGRDFVSGEKLSVCDGGRDACVRIRVESSDRIKRGVCSPSSFLDFVHVGKTLIGQPRGPAGPSPACKPAERRPSQGGQGRSGGSALTVNPPPCRPLRLKRFSAQAGKRGSRGCR